ncbi:hypothetical protein [Methanobrevibacter sp.]
MAVENKINRDLFFKICFMYFLIHILKVLGIKEEIEEILSTEIITMDTKEMPKIFDNFLDFRVLTKSGKILIFEFKKHPLTRKDLKQAYHYYDRVHCKDNVNVKLIIIVISDKGKIREYSEFDITYHPQIIKTKKFNKQKDLIDIRDKLDNDKKLNPYECSLLITFPLFQLNESESEIVEEMCKCIKEKKHCIPDDELSGITMGMYLNILEYIEVEKQEELMEMIDLTGKFEGELAKIEKKGMEKGKRSIIARLLENHSLEEVSKILDIEKATLISILQK